MAKIIFVVNAHPDEAFAIGVARRTAKLMQAEGHEVIWVKAPFAISGMGRVLQAKKGKLKREHLGDEHWPYLLKELFEKSKADLLYDFHCTPNDHAIWERKYPGKNVLFEQQWKQFGLRNLVTVEIKAAYIPLPQGLKKRIDEKMMAQGVDFFGRSIPYKERYLEHTSSVSETKKIGILPNTCAQEIATQIMQHTKTVASGEKLQIGPRHPFDNNAVLKLKQKARARKSLKRTRVSSHPHFRP